MSIKQKILLTLTLFLAFSIGTVAGVAGTYASRYVSVFFNKPGTQVAQLSNTNQLQEPAEQSSTSDRQLLSSQQPDFEKISNSGYLTDDRPASEGSAVQAPPPSVDLDNLAVALDNIDHYVDLIPALNGIAQANEGQLLASLKLLNQLQVNSTFSTSINAALYQRWAELDIDAALDYLLEGIGSERGNRQKRMRQGLEVLAELQPQYVLPSIVLTATLTAGEGFTDLLDLAGTIDPESMVRGALLAMRQAPDEQQGRKTLAAAFYHWGDQDPRAALEFLDQDLEGKGLQSLYRMDILSSWLEANPGDALAAIEDHLNQAFAADPQGNLELAAQYVTELSKNDPASAFQWAESQGSQLLKDSAILEIADDWAESNSAEFMNFVGQLDPQQQSGILPAALSALAFNLTPQDVPATLEWIAQLPSDVRSDAEFQLVNDWASNDSQAVMTWLQENPATSSNQQIYRAAAQSIVQHDPEQAKQLFQQMSAQTQAELTERMVFSLAQHGKQYALDWLRDQSNDEVKERGYSIVESIFAQ